MNEPDLPTPRDEGQVDWPDSPELDLALEAAFSDSDEVTSAPASDGAAWGAAVDLTMAEACAQDVGADIRPVVREIEAEGRYEILGELGRGGMGIVLAARDLRLGRIVAIKVLQELRTLPAAWKKRFLEEAQIAGQLSHPGLVPVHDIGMLPAGTPWFSMQAIRGHTLDAWILDREVPPTLRECLTLFLRVAETVAFAHAKGVIHRDLKPSNIMIGDWGQVFVMDWGLAEVLRGDAVAEATGQPSGKRAVVGTPAYMAPEQARGEPATLSAQTDVFALGGLLLRLLTGRAPFEADSTKRALERAAAADLGDARDRLSAREVPAEIVALVMDSLSAEAADRPANAGALRDTVQGWLDGADERDRLAEIDSAAARARLEQAARSRSVKLTLLLLLGLLALVAGGLTWKRYAEEEQRRDDLRAEFGRAWEHAHRVRDRAAALESNRLRGWERAAAAAEALVATTSQPGADAAMERRAAALAAEVEGRLARARTARRVVDRLEFLEGQRRHRVYAATFVAFYDEPFALLGLDLEGDPAQEGAALRSTEFQEEFVRALDAWALMLHLVEDERWRPVLRIASATLGRTPDDELRSAILAEDPELASDLILTRGAEMHASSLVLASLHLLSDQDPARNVQVLRRVLEVAPTEFWCWYHLGNQLFRVAQPDNQGAIHAFGAALSLEPLSPFVLNDLGRAFLKERNFERAEEHLGKATRTYPRMVMAWQNLGAMRFEQKRFKEAADCFRKVIAIDEDHLDGHLDLARSSRSAGDHATAVVHARWVLDRDETHAQAWQILGWALYLSGRHQDAIDAMREVTRHAPEWFIGWRDLANMMRKHRPNDLEEALGYAQKARDMAPEDGGSWFWVASIAYRLQRFDLAADAGAEAVRLDAAIYAPWLTASACIRCSRFDRALHFAELAIAKDPEGKGFGQDPTAFVQTCRDRARLEGALQDALAGRHVPKTSAEWLQVVGQAAYTDRRMMEARAWRLAFDASPELFEDRRLMHRLRASESAALVFAGDAKDAQGLEAVALAPWCRRALTWLGDEFDLIAQSQPKPSAATIEVLRNLKVHPAFRAMRGDAALAALPADQRRRAKAVWAQLDRLIELR